MRKVALVLIGIIFLSGTQLLAQTTGDNTTDPATWSGLDLVYKKQHIVDKKPVPYENIREADIMWSKVAWRMIDYREKMNQPLYFPTVPIGNRMSLISVLLEAIESGELTAYRTDFDNINEFKEPISYEQVIEEFDAQDRVQQYEDLATGQMIDTLVAGEVRTDEVLQLLVKEMWFFDKKRSVMEVRIIGLCPIRVYYDFEDLDKENLLKKKLFWVKFPEARDAMARHEVFNASNDAERRSFDEIFYKRFFDGYIVQESNVYNNRMIQEYTLGVETLQESERVEEFIFQFEHDLWEF
ncbi:MAG: gliding motility protein GldN [Bacteroidota bacterium]|nr:gliding motility protein GldN [Bacteroidota bacterium]